ncbi:hypothetical protein [Dysgonomonas sp. 511]|uniref:hypothetical protein n=1 Tax=Dysgonomonas sp. 511 TaxID=2302930 RepID=UPI0013D891CC|nr:hypothetical protein [Dysgonomonas sp. 511]NDV78303.1 hypothetical protein [Dysgonomonas sp. 511]
MSFIKLGYHTLKLLSIIFSVLIIQLPLVGIAKGDMEYEGLFLISPVLFGTGACCGVFLYGYCRRKYLREDKKEYYTPVYIMLLAGIVTFMLISYCQHFA